MSSIFSRKKKEDLEKQVNVAELVGDELYDVCEWVLDRADNELRTFFKPPPEDKPKDIFKVNPLDLVEAGVVGTLFYDAINTTDSDEQLQLVHLLGLLFNNEHASIQIVAARAYREEDLPLKELQWGKLYSTVQYETQKRKKLLDAYMNFDEAFDETLLLNSEDEDDMALKEEIPSYAIIKKQEEKRAASRKNNGRSRFQNEMAVDRPHKQGWIYKQGGVVSSWKKRYMVIDNDQLAYYRLITDIVPAGSLSLLGCVCGIVEDSEDQLGFDYAFYLDHPSGRRYMLRGMSNSQVTEWLNVMQMSADAGPGLQDLTMPNQATGEAINDSKANFKVGWDDAGVHLDAKREDSNMLLDFDRLTSSEQMNALLVDPEIELASSDVVNNRINRLLASRNKGEEIIPPTTINEEGEFVCQCTKRAPGGFRTWKERYFVVTRDQVKYYEDDTREKQCGSFPLNAGSDFRTVYIPFFPNSFNITQTVSDRMYTLHVDDEETVEQWKEVINYFADQHALELLNKRRALEKKTIADQTESERRLMEDQKKRAKARERAAEKKAEREEKNAQMKDRLARGNSVRE